SLTTLRISSRCSVSSAASSISPLFRLSIASTRWVGRIRLPTWSARNWGWFGLAMNISPEAAAEAPRGPLPTGAGGAGDEGTEAERAAGSAGQHRHHVALDDHRCGQMGILERMAGRAGMLVREH